MGQVAIVSGWGGTVQREAVNFDRSTSCTLKSTKVKVLKDSAPLCKKDTGNDAKTRMCAWAKDTDSCQGWKFMSCIVIAKSLVNNYAGSWLAAHKSEQPIKSQVSKLAQLLT